MSAIATPANRSCDQAPQSADCVAFVEQITVDDVLGWGPCGDYNTADLLLAVTDGCRSLTPLQVLDLDIQWCDRFWVLLRPEVLSERTLRLYAADCAEHVLHLYEHQYDNDSRPRTAIGAARVAAWAAARVAARDAARVAAWAAARDVAWAAAGDAARDAEVDWQRERLRAYLMEACRRASRSSRPVTLEV